MSMGHKQTWDPIYGVPQSSYLLGTVLRIDWCLFLLLFFCSRWTTFFYWFFLFQVDYQPVHPALRAAIKVLFASRNHQTFEIIFSMLQNLLVTTNDEKLGSTRSNNSSSKRTLKHSIWNHLQFVTNLSCVAASNISYSPGAQCPQTKSFYQNLFCWIPAAGRKFD